MANVSPDHLPLRALELNTPAPLHRSPTIDGSGVDLLNSLNNSRVDKLRTTSTTELKATGNAVVVVPVMELQYPVILQGSTSVTHGLGSNDNPLAIFALLRLAAIFRRRCRGH